MKLATLKTAAEGSTRQYILHINMLDKVLELWHSEHAEACEVFEAQEYEQTSIISHCG